MNFNPIFAGILASSRRSGGGGGGGSAPAVTASPVIISTPTVGSPCTYVTGSYSGSPSPSVTARQWLLDDVPISGATGTTYTPVSGDVGHVLKIRETASNVNGSVQGTSAGVTVQAASSYTITADFAMTRTDGFMPVQVTFDAGAGLTTTNVTELNAAGGVDMQLYYVWDYGDNQGKTWAISGQPKNSDAGAPVQAHIYDDADGTTAGDKTVTLTVYGGHPWQAGGQSRMQTIVYDVGAAVWVDPAGGTNYNTYICATSHSPSSSFSTDLAAGKWTLLQTGRIASAPVQKTFTCKAYSAANTLVVNPTGTDDGTVPGATYRSTMPNAATANGKLTLVKRGMTGLTIPQFTGTQYGAFKAYGSGAKPSLSPNIYTAAAGQAAGTNSSYSDFQIPANGINAFGKALCLRIDVVCPNSLSVVADAGASAGNGEPTADFSTYSDVALVDCNIKSTYGGPSYNWYGAMEYLTIMGCDFQGAGDHELRAGALWRSVIAHNRFRGDNPSSSDILKIHAGSTQNVYNGPGSTVVDTANPLTKTTSRVTIAYNEGFSATSTSYMFIHPAPQNTNQAEGVFKVWVEYNWMAAAPGTGAAYGGGRDIAIRRNQNKAGSAFTHGTGHSGPTGWTTPYYLR